MAKQSLTIHLETAEDTDHLGAALSLLSNAGDCLLLKGHIGAGKSALARAFIRARLGQDTEVPSPTFTLVQTYTDGDVEIWHADLYRLSDTQEAIELGLIDAFEHQICLIEWPELLGDLIPKNSLEVTLAARSDGHIATLILEGDWVERLDGFHLNA